MVARRRGGMLDLRTIENSIQRIQERIERNAASGAGVDPRDQSVLDKLNEQKRVILSQKASVGEPTDVASQVKRAKSGVPAGEPEEVVGDVVAVRVPEVQGARPPADEGPAMKGMPPIESGLSGEEIFFEKVPSADRTPSSDIALGRVEPEDMKTKISGPLRHSSTACSFEFENLAERMSLALGYGEKQAKNQEELKQRYRLVLLVLNNCISERLRHRDESIKNNKNYDKHHANAINVTQNLYNFLNGVSQQKVLPHLSFRFQRGDDDSFSFIVSFPKTTIADISIGDAGNITAKRKRRGGRKTHRNRIVRKKTRKSQA